MTTQVSTIRQDGSGKLTITSDGAATSYLYPPFQTLLLEPQTDLTKVVLRADTADHVFFVQDSQSLEIVRGFRSLSDGAAVQAALKQHVDQVNRAERAKSQPPSAPNPVVVAAQNVAPPPQPAWSSQQGPYSAPGPRSGAAARAFGAARGVEILAWVGAIIGVIAGIVVGAQSESDGYYDSTTHPHVGIGILIAVVSVAQALPTIMVAAYIQSRTE